LVLLNWAHRNDGRSAGIPAVVLKGHIEYLMSLFYL
jgi:hypothetical protein